VKRNVLSFYFEQIASLLTIFKSGKIAKIPKTDMTTKQSSWIQKQGRKERSEANCYLTLSMQQKLLSLL
jgi:hypothetical protein